MAASSSPDNDEASLPLDRPRSDGEDEARTALIVNYLPQSMSESELFSMFITLGPIKAHRIACDHRRVAKWSLLDHYFQYTKKISI